MVDGYVKVATEGASQVINPETGLPTTVEELEAAGLQAVKDNEKAAKAAAKAEKAE
jgi:hypothetical protein